MKIHMFAIAALLGCTQTAQPTTVTPPPAPVPLALVVNPLSRKATAQPGTAALNDNAALTFSGDNSATAAWTANNRHSWITITAGSGTGSGTASWSRHTAGLAAGTYVDTIAITAAGATGSPAFVIDTLLITTAPVPRTLVVSPLSRNRSTPVGVALAADNVAITLAGDNAATTAWTATKRRASTTLNAAGGTGSGTLSWQRNVASLAVGTYVDTITITATGAAGSPVNVIDTLVITPAAAPLTLAVTPHSRSTTTPQGGAAADDNVAVTLTGDGAATASWFASGARVWTSLVNGGGTGSGTLAWHRNAAGLNIGTYVDTLIITANGAAGSPIGVIDTLVIANPVGVSDPDLGINTSLHGRRIFPASDPWNQPVDTAQRDPNSDAILAPIAGKSLHPDFGSDPGGQFGYTYIVVPDGTQRSFVDFVTYGAPSESDAGPYPIPLNPPIEQGSDAHLFMITQHEWKLYELDGMSGGPGAWLGYSGAIWDMTNGTRRPDFWTSADAAGLPMIPGMVRYDEVYETGAINHALRFTITNTRRAFVSPATHFASHNTSPLLPPMGMRVRLKANVDISSYPAEMQVILKALKKYGMMVADNGGDFFLSGITDLRWNNDMLNLLKNIHVSDFEVVKMGIVITD